MVKDSCLEEVGVCVLDGRLGRLTPGARARNLFDCIRSSREIGYFFGFLDSTGEVDEEEDEDCRSWILTDFLGLAWNLLRMVVKLYVLSNLGSLAKGLLGIGFTDSLNLASQSSENENTKDDFEAEGRINQIQNDDALTDSSDEATEKEANTINVLTKEQDLLLELIEQIAEPEKWQLYLAKFKESVNPIPNNPLARDPRLLNTYNLTTILNRFQAKPR
ncbi:hypothetical protein ACH5RR_032099 [Cinchona calisaya]|uniref:Uncharacterized protein n=1 Tax=Cinchona calisaya TaxID=153742 RepID=A0ABD2YLI6_9GENT